MNESTHITFLANSFYGSFTMNETVISDCATIKRSIPWLWLGFPLQYRHYTCQAYCLFWGLHTINENYNLVFKDAALNNHSSIDCPRCQVLLVTFGKSTRSLAAPAGLGNHVWQYFHSPKLVGPGGLAWSDIGAPWWNSLMVAERTLYDWLGRTPLTRVQTAVTNSGGLTFTYRQGRSNILQDFRGGSRIPPLL